MQIITQQAKTEKRLSLPIGFSNFGELIRRKLDFVDKTLLIKEILDNFNVQASVIIRPRRFGKTLNLSMLQYFLAAEVNGQSTQGLFDGLKIAGLGDQYMQHQGKYPVIFLTFKDLRGNDYETVYADLYNQISEVYGEHRYLLSSVKLADDEKQVFLSLLERKAEPAEVHSSLRTLSHYLYKHTGVKPWILIDEYDTPIQSGYLNGYYDAIIASMKSLFGTTLKDNNFLERAVVTGILRISKESLFSGVNNIRVYSILDPEYSEHFGFTENEVEQLLTAANLSDRYVNIRQWYNGYQIGNSVIYNPWSLVNCINGRGLLKPYWVNTSSNDLVKHLLAYGDESVKMDLEAIIHNESITALIDENMVFGDLEKDSNAMWSLLLFSGYLKAIHIEYKDDIIQCELTAPNQEVSALYRGLIKEWLANPLGYSGYLKFLLNLTEGKVDDFIDQLQQYLIRMLSIFDVTGHEPEKFYHGFVLGLMVSLSDTHEVKSNHESGYGRYDVMLIPKDDEQLGIVIEFKTVRDKKIDLAAAAQEALQQIEQRAYAVALKQRGIRNILKMGLAFRNKQVAHAFARE